MSALTTNRYTKHRDGLVTAHPVAEAAHIFKGSLVCANADGYAAPGADTAGFTFLGVALEEADNTDGADGGLTVKVLCCGVFLLGKTGTITQASLGAKVYIADDQTVALAATTTNDVPCGRIEALDGSALWIRIGL